MSTVMFRLSKGPEGSLARASSLPPPTKPSKGNPSRPRPSSLSSGDMTAVQKNSSLRRRSNSPITTAKQNRSKARKSNSRDLVMEEVKILKRGEAVCPLSPPSSPNSILESSTVLESPTPCLTDLLGPDPQDLPKPSGKAYAGPAFVTSPSPNTLPVPFFLKKAVCRGEDVATRSLMFLLRLDACL